MKPSLEQLFVRVILLLAVFDILLFVLTLVAGWVRFNNWG